MSSGFAVGRPRPLLGCASLCLALLGGCATYHSLPLPQHADLAQPVGTTAAPAAASLPRVIDLGNVGRLARTRDPNLAASRDRVRVARAQAYEAGLLPDPTLGLSLGHPFNGGTPSDHHNPWSANLAESLVALITHGDRHSAASAHYAEALLSWRWQAAQVALKARSTYVEAWATGREVQALRIEAATAKQTLSAARNAHAAGALSSALYQQALQQYSSIRSRLQGAADKRIQLQSTLANLLRLRTDHHWHFLAPVPTSAPAPARVKGALEKLPKTRLDLLALQAGYRSADAHLRADILAQFPILNVGFTRSRDNTGVNSVGFGVTLRLPIFNGNRGAIAVARATRKALNSTYQARLDSAANTAWATYERLRVVDGELHRVAAQLPALAQAAHSAQRALAQGNMTRFQTLGAQTAWLDTRIDTDRLRAQAARLTLTLDLLLALPANPSLRETST